MSFFLNAIIETLQQTEHELSKESSSFIKFKKENVCGCHRIFKGLFCVIKALTSIYLNSIGKTQQKKRNKKVGKILANLQIKSQASALFDVFGCICIFLGCIFTTIAITLIKITIIQYGRIKEAFVNRSK